MTMRIVNSMKYVGLFALIFLSVVACERDFENIGVGLVDNDQFTTKKSIFEVISYNKNDDFSQVNQDDLASGNIDGLTQYLLGVYNDGNFGFIKTSFISQLGLPASPDFGDSISIDAVILDIPYYVTDTSTTGTPDFKLDSIIGDQSIEFNLSVYESGTFLNSLDPQDPTKTKKYYSNEEYSEKTLLYSELFKPNRHDTVLYVERRFLDDDMNTVDDTDTIKAENLVPSIKLPLDTVFFRNNFINQQNSGIFDANDNFINHFRGIIIKAEEDVVKNGSLMTLQMSNANLRIYYTNTILTDESGTDLNDNGTTDDTNVPVRTKQTMIFPISGIRASTYIRDYSESLVNINDRFVNPDMINGEDKLYIQGAAGSRGVVELFKGLDLDSINAIREENWLINEANLVLYLDESSSTDVPEQLFLYRFDDNSQILDVFTEAQINGIGGFLERDDDGKPIQYKFRITDYISEVLKSEEPLTIEKLGLKVFHSTDAPDFTVIDTIIKDFSWIAKGVVLKGNNIEEADMDYAERLKLEIFYTINNE